MLGEKPNYNEVKEDYPNVYGKHDSLYEEESVNMKDFVIGAFVGGIVGAAVGLLLAPKTGKELRDEVATQAVNLKEKSITLSSTAKEKTVELVDKVKAKTSKVKTPTVFDDGTVSAEGEEPLEIDSYDGVVGSKITIQD